MKKSHKLFELISTLSKSEKRYLRLFASLHGSQKGYVRLLDALQQTREYNEADFLKQHAEENFAQNYSFAKGYLYNFILKSLESFHANAAVKSELTGLLQKVDVLFDKALYEQCIKLLKKAKHLAYRYDNHRLLLEVLTWQLRIVLSPTYASAGTESVSEILEEEARILSELQAVNTARSLRFGIVEFLQHSASSAERRSEHLHTIKNKLDKIQSTEDSLMTRSEELRAQAYYHFYFREWSLAYSCVQQELDGMEATEDILLDRTWQSKYIMATGLAADISIQSGQFERSETLLQRLLDLSQVIGSGNRKSAHLSMRAREQFTLQKLKLLIRRKDTTSAAAMCRSVRSSEFYPKACEKPHLGAQLHLSFAVAAFNSHDLSLALDDINRILADSRITKNVCLYYGAICLAFVLHFENDNPESAEYMLRMLKVGTESSSPILLFKQLGVQVLRSRPIENKAKLKKLVEDLRKQEYAPELRALTELFDSAHWFEQQLF